MTGIDDAGRERDGLYAPLGFLRQWRGALAVELARVRAQSVDAGQLRVLGTNGRCYLRRLDWDTEFFGFPVDRVDFVEWRKGEPHPDIALAATLAHVRRYASRLGSYVFAEIPADDLPAVQAFSLAGFRLVETRATYYQRDVRSFTPATRWPVRLAGLDDISDLVRVARDTRNPYDRYHADPIFAGSLADRYLGAYAEASVRGLADAVHVPDPQDGEPPGAFFTTTVSRVPADEPRGRTAPGGFNLGRIVLVAVGHKRRGWHARLLSECTAALGACGVDVVCMTTQIVNRPVTWNAESLGYRLGRVTHVFSCGGPR